MTFEEFIAEQLMGPPAFTRSQGESSYWHCPFHDDSHPSFHSLPPHPKYKNRFKCHPCGKLVDVFDLLQRFFPHEHYGDRLHRLNEWRQEFDKAKLANLKRLIPCRGDAELNPDPTAIVFASQELQAYLRQPRFCKRKSNVLDAIEVALQLCQFYKLDPTQFADHVKQQQRTQGMSNAKTNRK